MSVQRQASGSAPPARIEELEALLEQTAALVDTAATVEEFAPRLLEAASRAAQATGAALWATGPAGTWQEQFATGTTGAAPEAHAAFAAAAERSRRLLVLPPGGRAEPSGPVNPADEWLFFAPATSGRVLELRLGKNAADDRRILGEIARSFAEVAGGFFERRDLTALRARAASWRQMEGFLEAIHRPLSVAPTAYAIANDGRLVSGCDRLSVAVGRRGRIASVSGVETVDSRSEAVRSLEAIAAAAMKSGGKRWLLTAELTEPLPRRLARAWADYRSSIGASRLELAILDDPRDPEGKRAIGTLLGEWFEPRGRPGAGIDAITGHSAIALANALEAAPGPLRRLSRRIAAPLTLRHLPKTVLAAIVVAAAAAALLLVKADFTVDARGELRPAELRDVFAPRDGIVRQLAARHGQQVQAGEGLLILSDPTLDLELERVLGESRTTRQRLVAVQAARTTGSNGGSGRTVERNSDRTGLLAGEERELTERLAGLERQLAILNREQEALSVTSPIEGVVLTWETAERLDGRPVRRGQRLLTVAKPEGEWLLELAVPDRRIGHVLRARLRADGPLGVDYLLATDPSRTFHEEIESIALSAEPDDAGEASVRVTARMPRSAVPDPRPGASVAAKIHCGRRPLGFVWFHEVIEAVRTHVLF